MIFKKRDSTFHEPINQSNMGVPRLNTEEERDLQQTALVRCVTFDSITYAIHITPLGIYEAHILIPDAISFGCALFDKNLNNMQEAIRAFIVSIAVTSPSIYACPAKDSYVDFGDVKSGVDLYFPIGICDAYGLPDIPEAINFFPEFHKKYPKYKEQWDIDVKTPSKLLRIYDIEIAIEIVERIIRSFEIVCEHHRGFTYRINRTPFFGVHSCEIMCPDEYGPLLEDGLKRGNLTDFTKPKFIGKPKEPNPYISLAGFLGETDFVGVDDKDGISVRFTVNMVHDKQGIGYVYPNNCETGQSREKCIKICKDIIDGFIAKKETANK